MKITKRIKTNFNRLVAEQKALKRKEEQEDKERSKQSLMFHGWYRRLSQKRATEKAMIEDLIRNGIIQRHLNPRDPATGRFIKKSS